MTELVVNLSFSLISQYFVGFRCFFELGLRFCTARVSIGVVLHGGFAIGTLDLRFGGRTGDGQYFVIVAFAHGYILKIKSIGICSMFWLACKQRRYLVVFPRKMTSMVILFLIRATPMRSLYQRLIWNLYYIL